MLTTISAAPVVAPPQIGVTPARKVVLLLADSATQAAMRAWCEAASFDLAASYGGEPRDAAEFDFHLTLFATVETSTLPELDAAIAPLTLAAVGFDAFGPDADTPVLLLDADPELQGLREWWLDEAEATPTYAEFRPHVSLSYAWSGVPALVDLAPPPFPLTFDRLEVRNLDAPAAKSGGPTARKSIEPLEPEIAGVLAALPGGPDLAARHAALATELADVDAQLTEAEREVDAAREAASTAAAELSAAGIPLSPADRSAINSVLDAALAQRADLISRRSMIVADATAIEIAIETLIDAA